MEKAQNGDAEAQIGLDVSYFAGERGKYKKKQTNGFAKLLQLVIPVLRVQIKKKELNGYARQQRKEIWVRRSILVLFTPTAQI